DVVQEDERGGNRIKRLLQRSDQRVIFAEETGSGHHDFCRSGKARQCAVERLLRLIVALDQVAVNVCPCPPFVQDALQGCPKRRIRLEIRMKNVQRRRIALLCQGRGG